MFRFLLLVAALACPLFAGVPTDDDVFREFAAWYKITYKGSFAPPLVQAAYEGRLKEQGIDAAESERRIGILRKRMAAMPPEFTALHFDRIYGMEAPPFRTASSQFLVRIV
jgi:hypothetical protein